MPNFATTDSIDAPTAQADGNIRILLVDDHPSVRDALLSVIEEAEALRVCGEANSPEEALQQIERQSPDLAILDLSLKNGHGLDLLQILQDEAPGIILLVFSMYDEEIYAERTIRAGASGYLMKSEPVGKIVEAVRAVVSGELYLSRRMSAHFLNKIISRNDSAPNRAVDVLTDREMQVFQMLGEGYSIREIKERLNLARKTIETYRRQAKEKLDCDSVGELLRYAVRWRHRCDTSTFPPSPQSHDAEKKASRELAVSCTG